MAWWRLTNERRNHRHRPLFIVHSEELLWCSTLTPPGLSTDVRWHFQRKKLTVKNFTTFSKFSRPGRFLKLLRNFLLMLISCVVMDNAVGCYAYGNIFWCMWFKLYLGSSDDIPTEQTEELALFSQFRDAPIPKPRDGHVISGHWRTRSRASTPVDSERPD